MNSCWRSEGGASAPRERASRCPYRAAVFAPALRSGAAPPDAGHIPASFVGGVCPAALRAGSISPAVRLILASGANVVVRPRDRGRASVTARIGAGIGDARVPGRWLEGWAGAARALASEWAVGLGQGERRGEKRAQASGVGSAVRAGAGRASGREGTVRAGAGRALGGGGDARASGHDAESCAGDARAPGRDEATRWGRAGAGGEVAVGGRGRASVGARSEARALGREARRKRRGAKGGQGRGRASGRVSCRQTTIARRLSR